MTDEAQVKTSNYCHFCEHWDDTVELKDLMFKCTHSKNQVEGKVYGAAPLASCENWEPNEAWYKREED